MKHRDPNKGGRVQSRRANRRATRRCDNACREDLHARETLPGRLARGEAFGCMFPSSLAMQRSFSPIIARVPADKAAKDTALLLDSHNSRGPEY